MSQKFIPKGLVTNNSALVLVMGWCLVGNKPLPEAIWPKCRMTGGITKPQWVHMVQKSQWHLCDTFCCSCATLCPACHYHWSDCLSIIACGIWVISVHDKYPEYRPPLPDNAYETTKCQGRESHTVYPVNVDIILLCFVLLWLYYQFFCIHMRRYSYSSGLLHKIPYQDEILYLPWIVMR